MSTIVEDERMGELEFEQKYVLDIKKRDEILTILLEQPNVKRIRIKQFYDDGLRYRQTIIEKDTTLSVKENKKGLKLGTPYSISLEQTPEVITDDEFIRKFEKSKRRLRKTRFEFNGNQPNQKVMVDFFENGVGYMHINLDEFIYAIVAEVETILNADTLDLNLRLPLPDVLAPYLLKKVDAREASSKAFKSANMIDNKENIEQIQKALAELYEPA